MHSKPFFIGSNDVDQFLELKLSSFFKMMQEVATEHAEMFNIGKANTLDKGLFWVITRIEVDIVRAPRYLENTILKTYPGDDLRFIFPRYFQLEDESGNVLIRASSTWMVLNRNTHNIVLNPFEGFKSPTEHLPDEQPLPGKVNSEEASLVEKRKVCYSDIDLNGHLNNTKYIDYIIDIHDSDFYKKHRISHFLINYEKELKDNDELSLYANNKNPEYIKGEAIKTAFEVLISYEDR